MDRDSPVEWTGRAHLVTMSCDVCDEVQEIPGTTAEYLVENDKPLICPECKEQVESTGSEMFRFKNPQKDIRVLADVMEAHGFSTKADVLRGFSHELDNMEPLLRGIDDWLDGEVEQTRQGLEDAIQKREER